MPIVLLAPCGVKAHFCYFCDAFAPGFRSGFKMLFIFGGGALDRDVHSVLSLPR